MDEALLDADVKVMVDAKTQWARLPIKDKIVYLEQVKDQLLQHAEEWVDVGRRLKDFAEDSPLVGAEEWLGGPYPTLSWLVDVIDTLSAIRRGEDPLAGSGVSTREDGQVVARVLPRGIYDQLLFSGYELDVWMQPEVTEQNLRDSIGVFYRRPDPEGLLTLVLGAGNVSAIPILDALYALIADGSVVLLKMNPINDAYGPVFESILEPLIRDGYVGLVYGGADVGAYLTHHEQVDAIHLTGSAETFNRVVFGSGESGQGSDATERLDKPVRSELGGVSPTIVVPGSWTDDDIRYQAEHIATQKLHSSGHACVASQVVILPQGWNLKDRFVEALRRALTDSPDRDAFYPGTEQRQQSLRLAHPEAEALASRQSRTLLVGLDPDTDDAAFAEEFFGPMLVTTDLPGDTTSEYLANAVVFANERLAGNLGANILVDPAAAKRHGEALEQAIADLRYGAVGVNAWSAFGFLASRAAWGAFPGNTVEDIQSGTGFVHNALLFDKPQKNVIRAPFRAFPRSARHLGTTMAVRPPWFVSNSTATQTARRFTQFVADPKPQRLPALFASALRG